MKKIKAEVVVLGGGTAGMGAFRAARAHTDDVYLIETDITTKGALIEKGWFVDRRDKLSRAKRWQQEDEDTEYRSNDLDKKVVNVSQIRTIITAYKDALRKDIFPNRFDENGEYEVPKTLVFAKTDSHADDIINIIGFLNADYEIYLGDELVDKWVNGEPVIF